MASTLTVADLAQRYSCNEITVLGWIRSGELRAINVGRSMGKLRPRWRITEEAIADFERLRSSAPAPAPAPRRKRRPDPNVIEFFK